MILITLILIIPIITFLILILSANYILGQYTGSSNLEEELKLAQEKVSRAGQEDTYTSVYSILNCDLHLDRPSIIKNFSSSNLTFNDSVNIVSVNPPDDWN